MVTIEDSDISMIGFEESDYEDDDDSFTMVDEENMAPVAKKKSASNKGKKAASKGKKVITKSKKNPMLSPRSEGAGNVPSAATDKEAKNNKKKTVEETYQKKSQLEHILLRPDTYIGSVEPLTEPMFIYDEDQNAIVNKTITYTPGLYKIFDEIIVNAADNKQRDQNMDKLDVTIDVPNNTISVKNNGQGIPVVIHSDHDCYVPTLIFGHLLTGSNFDDDEKKTTGGRNGYGAKLANIFSTQFIVECVDVKNGKKFEQTFTNNMGKAGKPIVKNCTAKEKKGGDYTKITFTPELARFKMTSLDNDIVGLLSKRAYDIAGSMANSKGKKLAVTLNGKKLPIKSFQDYIKIFKNVNAPCAYEKVDEKWEVGVSHSEDGSPIQISFVNSICTSKGGTHVSFVADKIAKSLAAAIAKKNKGGTKITNNQIKNHLCIFVNCLVENPTFDSQTKDHLTNRKNCFKQECELSDKFLSKACSAKGDIMENILSFAKFKANRELKGTGGVKKIKITGIQKLDDANRAGSKDCLQCTLILTEGDSAKTLAMSGLSVIGRDHYGVYPLKGKPLNVRDATHAAVMKNEEIKNVIDILGLKHGVIYDESNLKTLRYGHLMIMADQDHDGSHIKGLIINFLHTFWPSLLDIPGFLQQFITPIVKVTKGKKSETFFTLPQYEIWKEETGDDGKGWKIKYYKGLGTSTAADAKEYFSNLDTHEIGFERISLDVKMEEEEIDDLDFEHENKIVPDKVISSYGDSLIDMVFNKKRSDDRKDWLQNLAQDTYLDYAKVQQGEGVKYSQFINQEYILFSKADCERSIPHVMDGFKPSQRKVLFACFKRKLKDEIKVAQLSGYIGEHSAYHHGEASLHTTIINMAQSFVGSNNINLLTPSGQFGTRRMGGKDSASPRYIFTMIEKVTRTIFHPDDDGLLNYRTDDGVSIEPDHYMPVIPMVLVNGTDGIGTGWSSKIPNYDPRQIISNIRKMIDGEPLEKMHPFYSGFKGEITPDGDLKYAVKGIIERIDDTTLLISELPVRTWTQDCKNALEKLLIADKSGVVEIKDFTENHTDTTVNFRITAQKDFIDKWEKLPKGGLYAKFKLISSTAITNMNLFDEDNKIVKYDKPESILEAFFETRMEFYVKRKAMLVKKLQQEQKMLSNKARFVEEVCSGDLVVSNRKKIELLKDLQSRGYDLFDKTNESNHDSDDEDEDEDSTSTASDLSKGYEYLLGMKLWALTFEKAELLRRQLAERNAELLALEAKKPTQIWLEDLDAIEDALDDRDRAIEQAEINEVNAQKKTAKRQSKKAKGKAKKQAKSKKNKNEWNSEDEDSDEDMEEVEVVKKSTVKPKKTSKPKKIAKPMIEVDDEAVEKEVEGVKKSTVKPKKTSKPKKIAKSMIDVDDDEAVEKVVEVKSTVKPKKASKPKKIAKPMIDVDDDDEAVEDNIKDTKEVAETTNRAKRLSPVSRGRGRAKKSKIMESETESEDEADVALAKPRARTRVRAIAKTPTYTYSDDDDDDDSFMAESDDSDEDF